MSETTFEPEEPDGPASPPVPDPLEVEQEEQDEQEQTSARAAAAHGSDEIPKRLERAINDQRRRLSKIVGVDLTGQECPTCEAMGYTIGGSDPGLDFKEDQTKEACPTCNGLGQLISHSKAPGHELVVCIECAGQGWRNKPNPAPNVAQFPATQPATATPRMGFMQPDGTFVPFGENTPTTVAQ